MTTDQTFLIVGGGVGGEIERTDPEERSVVVDGRTLTGDQLVIALGAERAPEMIPGLAEAGHDACTLRGTEGLRDALAFAKGASAEFDVLAFVPPHHAPRPVRDAGLVDDSGWIPVDRATLETRLPRVYAIGDITSIPLTMGKPLPMAGVFAHGQAEVVAAHAITGKGETKTFDGHGGRFIETGDGKAGFGRGDFCGEPVPAIAMHPPARHWHWGKVLFEKDWLRRWFCAGSDRLSCGVRAPAPTTRPAPPPRSPATDALAQIDGAREVMCTTTGVEPYWPSPGTSMTARGGCMATDMRQQEGQE